MAIQLFNAVRENILSLQCRNVAYLLITFTDIVDQWRKNKVQPIFCSFAVALAHHEKAERNRFNTFYASTLYTDFIDFWATERLKIRAWWRTSFIRFASTNGSWQVVYLKLCNTMNYIGHRVNLSEWQATCWPKLTYWAHYLPVSDSTHF